MRVTCNNRLFFLGGNAQANPMDEVLFLLRRFTAQSKRKFVLPLTVCPSYRSPHGVWWTIPRENFLFRFFLSHRYRQKHPGASEKSTRRLFEHPSIELVVTGLINRRDRTLSRRIIHQTLCKWVSMAPANRIRQKRLNLFPH